MTYNDVIALDPKKFQDLEYTMKLIFDHDEEEVGEQGRDRGSNEATEEEGSQKAPREKQRYFVFNKSTGNP